MRYTIHQPTTHTEKIQKSTFIGHLIHIETPDQARLFITEINKAHPQANHNCPAYIVGKNGETCFCSDAGEPAGTAGKPILNMLQRHELTNICLIVTRYFGGVKLGIRGLIDAYSLVAEKTILAGDKHPVIDYFQYICTMPYSFYDTFTHKTMPHNIEIIDTAYSDTVQVTFSVSEIDLPQLQNTLNELKNNQKIFFNLLS